MRRATADRRPLNISSTRPTEGVGWLKVGHPAQRDGASRRARDHSACLRVTGRSPDDSTAVIWARIALSTRSDPSWARTGTSQKTELVEEKSDVIHAVYERIVIEGPRFVGLRLTPAAYRHGLALALPDAVMARPTGDGHADARSMREPGTAALTSQGCVTTTAHS
jgi:hypothetical protein